MSQQWRDFLADAFVWVAGVLIFGFLLLIAIGGNNQKQKECEQAGGIWLVRSAQCLPKDNK